MKRLLLGFVVVILSMAYVGRGYCQLHVVMQDGYTLTVDGTLNPYGTIVDDGDTSGSYSDGFYGNVLISALPGDTIIVYGSYSTENCCDHIYLYDGSPLGDMGMQLGSWQGSGYMADTSLTGSMTVVFSTDGSVNAAGFLLHYEVRPSNCSNTLFSFSYSNLTATSVTLSWLGSDNTALYLLHYGTEDTVVSGQRVEVGHLMPLTAYRFTLCPLEDTGMDECCRSLSLMTTSFKAAVSGLRPLCGIDTLLLVADSADGYRWSTGDTTRAISVTDTGWYWLVALTRGGTSDTTHFCIGNIRPDLETHLPTALCPGETAVVDVGLAVGSAIRVLRGVSTLSEAERIFLPDGVYCSPNGCSYRSELLFSGFEENAHISNVNDIRYVMLNIEHSWVGDIYINITCPNNQSADILRYGGSGTSDCNSSIDVTSRGWRSGSNVPVSTYLGDAYDYEGWPTCDSNASGNQPGTGWRYCWSNCTDAGYTYASGDGLIYRSGNQVGYSLDSSNVSAGTHFYHPDDSFANLIGCPMNGTWYIEVIDGWSGDNGYIFGWELALNPDRLSRDEYRPTVAYADLLGPYASRLTDTAFVITAPLHLTADTVVTYTVLITDSMGCVFDTSFSILFHASRSSFVYDTACENSLPRFFNGTVFHSDTTDVAFHYPSSSGCDSLVVYSLHLLPNGFASPDTLLCVDGLPLMWHDVTVSSSGSYSDTLVAANGCDSIVELGVTVVPMPVVQHSADTLIEAGDSIALWASGAECVSWSDSNGAILGCGDTIWVSPVSPLTFFVTGYNLFDARYGNVVVNGDFEHGDTAFASAYNASTNLVPEGNYCVGTDAHNYHPGFWVTNDHTSGSGNYMIVNGATSPNTVVWSQTVSVVPHTTYAFSAWVCSVGGYINNPTELARLQFSIGGSQVGEVFTAPAVYDIWNRYYEVWNSGEDTSIVITILNQNTVAGGNDFGIDDISFCPLTSCSMIDSIRVYTYAHSYIDSTVCTNHLPLLWHGNTINSSGSYTDTITDIHGGRNIVTLTLHVLPTVSLHLYDTICSNQSLAFEGTTYYSAGTYPHSFLSSRGCDSTRTLHLTVDSVSYTTIYATACDSYLWHDSLYTESTTGAQYTTVGYRGCDSVVTLHLTVNHSTDSDLVVEACDSYDWFGTHYLVPPASVPTHTLTNAAGCDSLLRLTSLVLHYSHQTDDYDTVCLNEVAGGYPWRDTVLYGIAASGGYSRSLTDMYGCDSLLTLTLTVRDSSSSQVYDTIVENQASTWQYNGIALSADTTLRFTLANQWGCDSVVTYRLHVYPNVSRSVDTTFCDDGLATFEWNGLTADAATDSLVATLVGQHGVDSVVTLRLHVNPTYHTVLYDTVCDNAPAIFGGRQLDTSGSYGLTLSTQQGCDSVVTLHLTVHATYDRHYYDTIYVGDTVEFEGGSYVEPGTYTVAYSSVEGCDSTMTLHLFGRNLHTVARADSICQGDTFYFYGRSLTEAGTYYDTAYSGDFFAGDTVVVLTLSVVQRPPVAIYAAAYCDEPAHYVLRAASGMPYLMWEGTGVVEGRERDSVIAIPNPADSVRITLYADYRAGRFCPGRADTVLTPIPMLHPLVDVRPTALTLEQRRLTAYNAGSGRITWQQWKIQYNQQVPFTDTVRRLRLDVPVYVDSVVLVLSVANEECQGSDSVTVGTLRADIYFPNVFTPSLRENNLFRPSTVAVDDYELWIYDRRGALVFHTTDIEQGWDGTHEGRPLPQAAYVYKCRYRDQLTPSGYQSVTGTVTLLR